MSCGELLLFRLAERLSKGRAACVHNAQKIASMLEKPKGGNYCERSVWTFLKALKEKGYLAYQTYRKGGKYYLEFWPLVRLSETPKRRFFRRMEPMHPALVAPKIAPSIAPSTPENCTLVEDSLLQTEPLKGEEQQTAQPPAEALADAVCLLVESTGISQSEAKSIVLDPLVRTATKGLSKGAIQHAVSCYQAAKNVLRPGAWLRSALRAPDRYSAPIAAPTHPSETPVAPIAKTVRVAPPPAVPQMSPEEAMAKMRALVGKGGRS